MSTGTGFDAYAGAYGDAVQRSIDFAGVEHDVFTRLKAAHLLELAARRLGPLERIRALDVGCGVGLTDAYLDGRLGAVHGVDTSEAAVARAAERNPAVRYRAYGGGTLPYGDASFDLAFAICVVHHVPPSERDGFASELRRVVRPGGLVAVFEHNPINPLTKLAVTRCEFDEDAVLLRAGEAANLLRRAGLRLADRRYIVFFPFDRPRARALERTLRWLPLAAQYYVAALR